MHGDILLENNFPNNYLPTQFHLKHVGLTLKRELATKYLSMKLVKIILKQSCFPPSSSSHLF